MQTTQKTVGSRIIDAPVLGHANSMNVGQNVLERGTDGLILEASIPKYLRVTEKGKNKGLSELLKEAMTSDDVLQKINAVNRLKVLGAQDELAELALKSSDSVIRGASIYALNEEKLPIVRIITHMDADQEVVGIAKQRVDFLESEINRKKSTMLTQKKLDTSKMEVKTAEKSDIEKHTATERKISRIEKIKYAFIRVNNVYKMEDLNGLKHISEHHWRQSVREAAERQIYYLVHVDKAEKRHRSQKEARADARGYTKHLRQTA